MNKWSKILSLVVLINTVLAAPLHAQWYSSLYLQPQNSQIESKLAQMSLNEKVGQLFIFGFRGTDLRPSLKNLIQTLKPGGLIVFGRNIRTARQIGHLNQKLQKISLEATGLPLLLALDQEGGEVSRIKLNPPLPSALSIGMAGDPIISERMGYLIGQMLSSLGFNMNLAPVMDLSDPEIASFIGTRSFGSNPQLVAEMTHSFARGLDQAGVLSTGKHFPSHGGVHSDSHKELPKKNISLGELIKSDLMPYSLFTSSLQSSAIMMAHVAFPNIDPSATPATFSKPIVSVLRQQLKFKGLVITDDIEMSAAAGVGSFEERALRAIEAGTDMVMVAWSRRAQRKAVQAVLKALQTGRLSETQINQAVRRILISKSQFNNLKRATPIDFDKFRKVIRSDYLKDLTHTILEKNFYAGLNRLSETSYIWTRRPVVVFSAPYEFFKTFQQSSKLPAKWVPFSRTAPALFSQKLRQNPRSVGLFYLTGRHSAALLKRLPSPLARRTLVINATAPGLISKAQNFLGVINIFSNNPSAGRLVAENLIRKVQKRGLASPPE